MNNNPETNRYLHSLIEPDGKWLKCNCPDGSEELHYYLHHDHCHIRLNPDYFTEKGFFVLWEWIIKQKRFYEFRQFAYDKYADTVRMNLYDAFFYNHFINYKTFPELLAEWVRGKNGT